MTLTRKKCPHCNAIYWDGDKHRCPTAPKPAAVKNHPPPATQPSNPPGAFQIDLGSLRPLEYFVWNLCYTPGASKITDSTILTMAEDNGISVEQHPAYVQVIQCKEAYNHLICAHTSHTGEKRNQCLNKQARVMAIRTVRKHLGLLWRLQHWKGSMATHGMFNCIEKQGRKACPFCRAREGSLVPVGTPRITVLHPGCSCSLDSFHGSQTRLWRSQTCKQIDYLQAIDPERAQTVSRNLAMSGFHPRSGGCGLTVVLGLCLCFLLLSR